MIKSYERLKKQNKERIRVPRTVQDTIPVDSVYKDGIFRSGNRYTKSYRFLDINYKIASGEDKNNLFLTYSDLLNSFDPSVMTKITINNRKVDIKKFKEDILIPLKEDGFVYIYLFTEDSIKGTDKYISQLGYSLAVQILFKSLILYAYTLIITTAFIIGYAISINFTDLDYLLLIVCSIAAALLFTITFACLMSIIFKKALDATAFQLVFFIIFDVLNIFTFGLTNPCDANSLATVTVRYISGIPIAHKSLESIKLDFETFKWVYTITPSIVYSIIIIIIILVLLCGKRVGGIYVTKHKD